MTIFSMLSASMTLGWLSTRSSSSRSKDRLAKLEQFLESHSALYIKYISGNSFVKRDILKKTTSNRLVDGKYLVVQPQEPFGEVAEAVSEYCCAPARGLPRISDKNMANLRQVPIPDKMINRLFKSLWTFLG